MNPNTQYTRIRFNRPDLFKVCQLGFIVQQVGPVQCTGWMLTDRLYLLPVKYQIQ